MTSNMTVAIPYGQKTHLRFQGRGVSPTEGSCRFPLIVLEQTTQPFLATHNSVIPARPSIRQGEEEPVLLALAREESRGAHFRTDFPEKRAACGKPSTARGNDGIGLRPALAI